MRTAPQDKTRQLDAGQQEQISAFLAKVKRLGGEGAVFDSDGRPSAAVSAAAGERSDALASFAADIIARRERTVREMDGMVGTALWCEGEVIAVVILYAAPAGCGLVQASQLRVILEIFAESFDTAAKAAEQVGLLSNELAQTYEEMMLLYKMTTNMKLTESDCNYLQLACDSLTELVSVEGIAILLERGAESDKRLVVSAGAGLIKLDQRLTDMLLCRLEEEVSAGREALLDSDVDGPFRYEWPDWIRSIMAVPLYRKDRIMGMMVATNRLDKRDFDSIDVKLFTSVASECAVFIENGRLFTDLKELFIGSLKALTSSIDAKDQYTRGHSERVAFVSRWIADKLAAQGMLHKEQVHRIYLAGLLHDVGKIGISESVLRKNGPLTDAERRQIQSHPTIGAGIISEIKQMRDIVPGVLCHHERYDGTGYPDGLRGDEIPLVGKIVMIADSFDAMTSKRTYRDAMTIPVAMEEIENQLGRQFDPEIGRVFLQSDIQQLWWIMQDGMVEHYYDDSFSAYGIEAVGTLIT